MHRTQIDFEESLFSDIKQQASKLNLSISAYIRETLKKDIEAQKEQVQPLDFSEFAGMWQDHSISQASLREKAWK